MNNSDKAWINGYFEGHKSGRDWKLRINVYLLDIASRIKNLGRRTYE